MQVARETIETACQVGAQGRGVRLSILFRDRPLEVYRLRSIPRIDTGPFLRTGSVPAGAYLSRLSQPKALLTGPEAWARRLASPYGPTRPGDVLVTGHLPAQVFAVTFPSLIKKPGAFAPGFVDFMKLWVPTRYRCCRSRLCLAAWWSSQALAQQQVRRPLARFLSEGHPGA